MHAVDKTQFSHIQQQLNEAGELGLIQIKILKRNSNKDEESAFWLNICEVSINKALSFINSMEKVKLQLQIPF